MTENEALSALHFLLGYEKAVDKGEIEGNSFLNSQEKEALQFILEEIQQYRAIGTVEELKYAMLAKEELERRNKYLIPVKNKERERLEQYQAIGTIEEFKALKEKVAKLTDAIDRESFLEDLIGWQEEVQSDREYNLLESIIKGVKNEPSVIDWQ